VRLIFVNYSHPDIDHVAGTRLREFARAMARRGHQAVLVSAPLPGAVAVSAPSEVARALDRHDWTHPFHVVCAPAPARVLAAARSGRMPAPLRRAVSLWSLVLGDGSWHDWVAGSKPYWPLLGRQFRPDLVWANFGSVSDLALAQGLARSAQVPWCADIKDNMQAFLPAFTRPLIARRFADAAGLTANAQFHADRAVFGRPAAVVYSGVDDALLAVAQRPVSRDRFRIMLVGSIYSDDALAGYLHGLEAFAGRLSPEQRAAVELCYAGHDVERLRGVAARLAPSVRLDLRGYLPAGALCEAYAGAAVNSYVWAGTTFHHKTVEMLATGRPVVAFPDEFDESERIAGTMRAALHRASTSDALADVLGRLHRQWLADGLGSNALAARSFTWDAGAEMLEQIFQAILRRPGSVSRLAPQPSHDVSTAS